MGATNHHHKWQVAIKTKGETATTTVLDIVWQTGRTGHVTPVLRANPQRFQVPQSQTSQRITLGWFETKDLALVLKSPLSCSGEVIPKLETALKPAENIILPVQCPSCDAQLSWKMTFTVHQPRSLPSSSRIGTSSLV